MGCAGHKLLRTPNIDSIAAKGVRLKRHYCNNPICTPSRATIITGRYPRSTRVYDNGCSLPEEEITLPKVLSQAGYTTHAVGKLHLSAWREPNAVSFESESFWASGKAPEKPVPYAGFDLVEICTRHINPNTGHYGVWLKNERPDVLQNWQKYLKPHSSGARESFVWTMPPDAHANTWIADRSIEFIKNNVESNKPFFLHVGFPDPHHPFRAPEPWGSLYDPTDVALPDTFFDQSMKLRPPEYSAFHKGVLNKDSLGVGDFNERDLKNLTAEQMQVITAITYGMISFVDEQIGRILDTLKSTGIEKNTIIVFTSDHGDLMGDHGLIMKGPFLLEGLVRTPMLVSGPGIKGNGRISSALTSHVDIMPTLLDLAGVEQPKGVEGKSFKNLLQGKTDVFRDRVLVEFLHQFQFDRNMKSIVNDRWKIIYWGGQSYGELYDLSNDPKECNNLWDDPDHCEIRNCLLLEILEELVQTENVLPLPTAAT